MRSSCCSPFSRLRGKGAGDRGRAARPGSSASCAGSPAPPAGEQLCWLSRGKNEQQPGCRRARGLRSAAPHAPVVCASPPFPSRHQPAGSARTGRWTSGQPRKLGLKANLGLACPLAHRLATMTVLLPRRLRLGHRQRRVPPGPVPHHGVEHRQQLAHAGHVGHLLLLPRLPQPLVHHPQRRVVPHRR